MVLSQKEYSKALNTAQGDKLVKYFDDIKANWRLYG